MRKLITMLVVLFLLYLGIQFLFTHFGKGESATYEIEKNGVILSIEENSTFRLKDNEDNYQFAIKAEDHTFSFQAFHNFNKITRVIQDIAYYKDDNYECILPIYKDKAVLSDFLCYQNDQLTYYYNIKGKNKNLDEFVNSISEYKGSNFVENTTKEEIEGITVYRNNLVPDHYIEITNYVGLYNISNNFNSVVYKISLYNKDVYNQKLSVFSNEYFLSADYNQAYEFHKFNLVDFVHLDTSTITSDNAISLDSYIQGVVDGKVYLYDKDNKKQYEIDLQRKTAVIVSSSDIKYYNNGTWETMSITDANNEKKFITSNNDYQDTTYDRIDKVGNDQGYYYLYKKSNNGYDVYRMDINNKDSLIYLYTTKEINTIFYVKNYTYFVSDNTIKVYHDTFGIKSLVSYKELEFNKNLNFHVYAK